MPSRKADEAQKASFPEVLPSRDGCASGAVLLVFQMTTHAFVTESQDHPQPASSSLLQNSLSVGLSITEYNWI